MRTHQHGFTLLEVLVATFIFAVAVSAMLKVLGESAKTLHQVELKQFATLTAHNQLALSALGNKQSKGSILNAGYAFNWTLTRYPTPDKRIQRYEIIVTEKGDTRVLAHLKAFRGSQ